MGFPCNQRWIMCKWTLQGRWTPPEHPRDTNHGFSARCLRLPIRPVPAHSRSPRACSQRRGVCGTRPLARPTGSWANGIANSTTTMTANGIRSSNSIGNDAVTTTATDIRSLNCIGWDAITTTADGTQSLKGIGSGTVSTVPKATDKVAVSQATDTSAGAGMTSNGTRHETDGHSGPKDNAAAQSHTAGSHSAG